MSDNLKHKNWRGGGYLFCGAGEAWKKCCSTVRHSEFTAYFSHCDMVLLVFCHVIQFGFASFVFVLFVLVY